MIYIILIVVVACIILTYYLYKEKLDFVEMRLNFIEEKIKSSLVKRKALLKDSEKLIKKILNVKKPVYENLNKWNSDDPIQFDRELISYVGEFFLIKDKYEKLQKDEEMDKLSYLVEENEDLIEAYKEFYNDIAEEYNKCIHTFPSSIMTFLKRRKNVEFFDTK